MDEQVIDDAARRIGMVVSRLYQRGRNDDRTIARAIGENLKRIQDQLHRNQSDLRSVCKTRGCGQRVPDVAFGRPRYYCESCHPPRYKVAHKVLP